MACPDHSGSIPIAANPARNSAALLIESSLPEELPGAPGTRRVVRTNFSAASRRAAGAGTSGTRGAPRGGPGTPSRSGRRTPGTRDGCPCGASRPARASRAWRRCGCGCPRTTSRARPPTCGRSPGIRGPDRACTRRWAALRREHRVEALLEDLLDAAHVGQDLLDGPLVGHGPRRDGVLVEVHAEAADFLGRGLESLDQAVVRGGLVGHGRILVAAGLPVVMPRRIAASGAVSS